MRRSCFGLCVFMLIACGDESGTELDKELDAFEDEANSSARAVCNASHEDVSGDNVSDAARCYFELAVEFTDCERIGMNAHAGEARALVACAQRDRMALVTCCSEGAACTYERIEQCYEQLWDGDSSGACDVDTTAIDAAIEQCEEREQRGSGMPHACTSDDPNC